MKEMRYPLLVNFKGEKRPEWSEEREDDFNRLMLLEEHSHETRSIFEKLDQAKVLSSIHLGKEATDAVDALERVKLSMSIAIFEYGRLLDPETSEEEYLAKRDEFKAILYTNFLYDSNVTDDLSVRTKRAEEKLRRVCDMYHQRLL